MSGDYLLEDSVYILFTTRAFATGIPGVLSAATVAVYEDVTATPIETSIAVTETLNSINGLNAVTIAALAASGYNAGGHYHVVIEAGTVDSVSVVGEVVGSFSIQSAPVNWAKVSAPTTAVDLSATDIQLADTATALTNGATLAAGAVTDASLAGALEIVFETDFATNYNTTRNAWVNNYTDIIGTMDAAAFGADFITAAKIADDAITSDQFAAGAVTKIWASIVETVGSRTAQQVMSILLSASAGVTADAGATLKDPAGTNTRISATIDGSNNRTAMTLTPSA